MKIQLIGDIWLTQADISMFFSKPEPDLLLANLETPALWSGTPIEKRRKAGPHIQGNAAYLKNITACLPGIKCVSLANNHAMDYGQLGLNQTISACRQSNVMTIGAGSNLDNAERPEVIEIGDIRVGIISCCETQFGIAGFSSPGVAPFSPRICGIIQRLKKNVDFIIASVHGSVEMSPWPSPHWQDQMRSLIDMGANLVHGHHSHVPQGYEQYNHGLIFYGLGNFLVKPNDWKNIPNTLWSITPECPILADYSVLKDIDEHVIRTVVISDKNGCAHIERSSETDLSHHLSYLKKCNLPLSNRTLLTGLWQELSLWIYRDWHEKELGFWPVTDTFEYRAGFRRIAEEFKEILSKRRRANKSILRYLLVSCESHRDVVSTALAIQSGEVEDLRTTQTKSLLKSMMPTF